MPCLFLNPKDLHDLTEYSDGLEMEEQDNLTDGDNGHLVGVGSVMMQRSRKSTFVPSLSSMLDRDINPGCASNSEKDGRGDLMMGVEMMPDVSDAEEAVQPSIIIESMEQFPPTEGNGKEGAHPMTGVETPPDSLEDEVEPTIIDQSKEPLLGSRGDEEDNPRVGINVSQMVKSTISLDSMVVDEDKPADRVQSKTPLMDSMEVDESLPVDGVDLKKSSDCSIAQIEEENDVNGDESYKTKLSVHHSSPAGVCGLLMLKRTLQ